MKITVTADHIARAVPGHCGECPIAIALRSATGRRWGVTEHWAWTRAEKWLEPDKNFLLPRTAWDFIRRFDAGKPVKPFSFEFQYL